MSEKVLTIDVADGGPNGFGLAAENPVEAKFDRIAHGYAEKYDSPKTILHFEKIRRTELLVAFAESIQPASILDTGCGCGITLSALNSRLPHAHVAGADISHGMLVKGRHIAPQAAMLVQSQVQHLPFAEESFDLVCALGLVDYLQNPIPFFQSVSRVLKPQGHLVFTYPNDDSVNRSFHKKYRMLRSWLKDRLNGKSRTNDRPRITSLKATDVEKCVKDCELRVVRRQFITYGNGIVSLPWSISISRNLELWLKDKTISRYLGWSGICIARKDVATSDSIHSHDNS